jgi:UDP-glucose 4-epimerase
MRCLVTGGAGFIGSHVVDELIKQGHKVHIIDDLSGGFRENVNPKAVLLEETITDAGMVNAIFGAVHFDYVFHLAAYAAEGLSHFIRNFNYTNNVIGSMNLINASINRSVKCFVFTSSIAVYGSSQTPMREDMIPRPEDPYGIAKYTVEMDLAAAHRMFSLPYIIFRPHNVYGERQNIGDPYRNVVGIFMNKILQGEPLPIFGDGEQLRAFTHISDVAPVIANSINEPAAYQQVFNIGADFPYTVNELADAVVDAMELGDPGIRFLPERNEVKAAYSSHEKVRMLLNGFHKTGLQDGLRQMADWVKSVGVRTGKPMQVEVAKNLPESWSKITA